MKKITNILVVLAVIVAFTLACGDSSSKASKTATASAKPKKVDGAKVYKLNCTVCHGSDGTMGASGAFNLVTSELTLDERIAVITNGRNTMTPFASILSEKKIKAVAEYTMTMKE